MTTPDYEKLGAFYLGKVHDQQAGATREELLLYDSKDLTTHAICVGMTGSGKTGLCLSLLEEAAIDGIPAIAIDPKGDLGNLFLTFPELRPADFAPWIDPAEATRKGMTPDAYAAKVAALWRNGLASWGQPPERIARFREAVDMAIYTPGSNAGLPMTVLRSFDAPSAAVLADSDAFRDRVSSATSGLLALLGIDADPIRSREHILVSNILSVAWQKGQSLDLPGLIGAIQSPPFEKVGIMDLESFFPVKDRVDLAMTLNNLLASPSFAGWMQGEPLDVGRLLYTAEGKPRLSVVSIAHLSESERMFFVTILLNEVLAWVRSQPGTSSLRALLYMDEVFGYFPPTANPPSKKPMLTLLKQARAYGLGVVLATQNPVDLDYKGLSNTGTWFLGRLQTERDKMRVLEGLEGASATAGASFDRQQMEATLAGLSSRVFLMNNVHDDGPVVFHTRWALSYLRGPLTRDQIATLMADCKITKVVDGSAVQRAEPTGLDFANIAPVSGETESASREDRGAISDNPVLPPELVVHYLRADRSPSGSAKLVYRPALLAKGKLHFARVSYKVDCWQERGLLSLIPIDLPDDLWEEARPIDADSLRFDPEAESSAAYASLPAELLRGKSYDAWAKKLKSHFYSSQTLVMYKCPTLKQYSQPSETEGEFRVRLRQLAREERDLAVEKLRAKYESKMKTIRGKIDTAEAAVSREQSQANSAMMSTAVSFGSTLLGALFGRKMASVTNVSKASTSMRSASRAAQQRSDVSRAKAKVKDLNEELEALEKEFKQEADELRETFEAENLELETLEVRPRKTDIEVAPIEFIWTPWQVDASGLAEPLFEV